MAFRTIFLNESDQHCLALLACFVQVPRSLTQVSKPFFGRKSNCISSPCLGLEDYNLFQEDALICFYFSGISIG